jgi:type VI secretion system secreted protein VgrG
MPSYVQTHRPMAIDTPLGPDKLLLVGFRGEEGLSRLFHFRAHLLAENGTDVPFDKLLGQAVVVRVEVPSAMQQRYFHGICSRVWQGESDETFTAYRLEIVPHLWLLTRRSQSRIFQHKSVPDILKAVLQGLNVTFEIQGTFHARDYCVQYRESDFAFASRLMEEEGLYYFFKHTAKGHTLVVANTPQSHPDLPIGSKLLYKKPAQNPAVQEEVVREWGKSQELTSGKVTLWDHCFELPHKHLEAERPIADAVQVGQVAHKLKVGDNGKLEIYDWPGAYAQRFDGIDKGGGVQAAEVQKIFEDNKRTADIRMQQEAVTALTVEGAGNVRQLVSGHKFTLTTLPGDTLGKGLKPEGAYVLTEVSHEASVNSDYRSGDWGGVDYKNTFRCLPAALPYRPQRLTPRPVVHGSQTAVVVGPPGEEIFTDKYSRIKVQFHWDREGKSNADSSCWIRVATIWAGKGWGIVNIPRIGQEVVVDFLEGDPDQPIVIGSVYNADHMPPGELPKDKMVSGLKSNSTPGGGGYNGLIFNDTKSKEKITLHGQYDMDSTIEHDDTQTVKNNRTITVNGTHTETIKKDTTIKITEGNLTHDVVAGTAKYHVKGAVEESYEATQKTTVTAAVEETYNATQKTTVKQTISIQSTDADIVIDGKTQIKLISGASSLVLKSDGTIVLSGKDIKVSGTDQTVTGVGNQTVTCDKQQVAVAGAAISSAAVGKHEISGAVVKLN